MRQLCAVLALFAFPGTDASGVVSNLFRDGGVDRDAKWQHFHDAIKYNQASCAALCVCDVEGAQLFSSIHGEAVCLLEAVLRNCTLTSTSLRIQKAEHWANCSSADLHACFLEPLHACPAASLARAPQMRFSATQYYGLHGEKFPGSRIAVRFGVRGRLRVFAEVVGYVLRPRARVAARVAAVASSLGLAGVPGDAVTAHSRQTDKRETFHGGVAGDAPATALLARHIAWTLGLGTIHFMTDAPHHISAVQNAVRADTSLPAVRIAALEVQSSDWVADLLAEIIVAGQGAALVGPLASNVDRVIYELMALVSYPPIVEDLYHESWVPGAEHLVPPGRPGVTAAAEWQHAISGP